MNIVLMARKNIHEITEVIFTINLMVILEEVNGLKYEIQIWRLEKEFQVYIYGIFHSKTDSLSLGQILKDKFRLHINHLIAPNTTQIRTIALVIFLLSFPEAQRLRSLKSSYGSPGVYWHLEIFIPSTGLK